MMTTDVPVDADSFDGLSRRQRRRLIVHAALRTLGTVAVVVAIYFLVPMDRKMSAAVIAGIVVAGLAFVAVVAFQLHRISTAPYPTLRAVESLSFTIPVYILIFATVYYLLDHSNPAAFGASLSRTDTMYFSTTVLTTVGFGDITAKTQAARIIVSGQMILDLLILGLVVRLVVNAVKTGQRRRAD